MTEYVRDLRSSAFYVKNIHPCVYEADFSTIPRVSNQWKRLARDLYQGVLESIILLCYLRCSICPAEILRIDACGCGGENGGVLKVSKGGESQLSPNQQRL